MCAKFVGCRRWPKWYIENPVFPLNILLVLFNQSVFQHTCTMSIWKYKSEISENARGGGGGGAGEDKDR